MIEVLKAESTSKPNSQQQQWRKFEKDEQDEFL
jgi:hypothetical protein